MKGRKKMKVREDYIFRGFIKDFGNKAGGIHVDWFDFKSFKSQYFLSHAHSDHYSFEDYPCIIGLFSPEFIQKLEKKPKVKIYCTAITKDIITKLHNDRAGVNELKDHFEILELNKKRDIDLLNNNGEQSGHKISVTTIPADHIPGAVMFLFEDGEKRALYTGDFRYEEMSVLRDFVEKYDENIDYLYVDITCLDLGKLYHPEQNKLPTRQESKDMVCELIRSNKPKRVHIDAEMVGAEDMVKAVAENFSNNTADEILSRLEASCPRRDLYEYTLKDIKIPSADTTCKTDLHIFDKAIFDAVCGKCDKDTLRIRASLKWVFTDPSRKYFLTRRNLVWIRVPSTPANQAMLDKRNPNFELGDRDYWQVLYSHHSSDFELREFLSRLKFKEVFPINEPFSRNLEGIYIKSDPETSSEKKHRHIRKSLYFSCESSSMKCNYKASNVLWLTGDNRDRSANLSDDKFQVTVRYFRNCENILSEVKNYNQPMDFILIPCTIELQRSLGKLYSGLFRFIDTLKEEIARRTGTIDNAVLFYSTTNNMNDVDKWKQIINSSRLYRDKKIPKVFYIDLTKIPEYTESNNLETRIIFETLKNLIRNEDKEVFVSDWPMPYELSERKREYDQERQKEPESQEIDMFDDTDDAEGDFVQSDEPQSQESEMVEPQIM